jgi:hypothetical protein
MKNRLLFAPLVAVALLVPALIATPAASAAKACSVSNLVVWAGEEADGGAAGNVYDRIQFTNLDSSVCTLFGFPTVRAVGLNAKSTGGRPSTRRSRR